MKKGNRQDDGGHQNRCRAKDESGQFLSGSTSGAGNIPDWSSQFFGRGIGTSAGISPFCPSGWSLAVIIRILFFIIIVIIRSKSVCFIVAVVSFIIVKVVCVVIPVVIIILPHRDRREIACISYFKVVIKIVVYIFLLFIKQIHPPYA